MYIDYYCKEAKVDIHVQVICTSKHCQYKKTVLSSWVLSLCSFNCVINRPGLRTVLSEKFLEVFGWFETELENVQKIYENQKVIETCTGTI